jgi:hypothetical protein
LADKDEKSVPSREEKRILKEAGLGEKKSIFTDKNGSFNHVKSTLEAQFRQLKDVRFYGQVEQGETWRLFQCHP